MEENKWLSTFHYGSIKIQVSKGNFVIAFISTFHYGSIKMWLWI